MRGADLEFKLEARVATIFRLVVCRGCGWNGGGGHWDIYIPRN